MKPMKKWKFLWLMAPWLNLTAHWKNQKKYLKEKNQRQRSRKLLRKIRNWPLPLLNMGREKEEVTVVLAYKK